MPNTAAEYVDFNTTSSIVKRRLEFIEPYIDNALSERRAGVKDAGAADSSSSVVDSDVDDAASIGEPFEAKLQFPELPRIKEPARRALLPLQEWEGYVMSVSDDGFTAQLVDLTAEDDLPAEEADFSLDDVSDPDRRLLREGAVFRWTIGYEKSVSGTKKRISQIVFRRLPQWTKKEIEAADWTARQLLSGIAWE